MDVFYIRRKATNLCVSVYNEHFCMNVSTFRADEGGSWGMLPRGLVLWQVPGQGPGQGPENVYKFVQTEKPTNPSQISHTIQI